MIGQRVKIRDDSQKVTISVQVIILTHKKFIM